MLKFFAQRRFNHIDMFAALNAAMAAANGKYIFAAFVFVVGVVVSAMSEYFLYDKKVR